MTRIVVVAHHPLATALRQVAEHVYPGCTSALTCVDVESDLSLEQATEKVKAATQGAADTKLDSRPPLVLVDTLGATPGRAARAALPGAPMVVGVNVPMLWRTLCYAEEPAGELLQRALIGGVRGIEQWKPED